MTITDTHPLRELDVSDLFTQDWQFDNTAPAETRETFLLVLWERYQSLLDANDALTAKLRDGPIRDAQEAGHHSVVAQYELIHIGATAENETGEIPDSINEYSWTSTAKQKELLNTYTDAALEAAPDEARSHLETIQETFDSDKADPELAEHHVSRWVETAYLQVCYRAVITSVWHGEMPFELARVIIERADSWWVGKEPDSKLAESYRTATE